MELLKTFASLLAILGLIFLLAYAFKRFGAGGKYRGKDTPGWRILGIKMLAPGKHIYVLEAGTKTLLIGSTDKMLTTLAEFPDEKDRQLISEALATSSSVSFRDILKRAEQ